MKLRLMGQYNHLRKRFTLADEYASQAGILFKLWITRLRIHDPQYTLIG
jgi:hypothetical protein